ncbi:MAG: exo-1,4-beta-D-glucosaminidase [Parcubacteria group bacterium Gr01-1014_46]|nr:MAG: exo-1,4-beta-D-glucosaminidase [Parcubacteria group bacterium Gr01-1014_46]
MKKYLKITALSIFVMTGLVLGLSSKNVTEAATTATLSLSPTSSSIILNQNFTVNILLDTVGNATDGVDVFSLHFNPAILQVVDSNASVAGVQIAPGSLMPATTANVADNTAGTIQFSQASSGGSNFTGSGILATITFRANAVGSSAVTMDFTPGNTADTNVAFQGTDLLLSVTNGTYTVVNPFDFSVTTTGGPKSVTQGSSVTQAVSSTLISGTAASVTFSASGLPTGATASFSPALCTPTCTTTMTITTTGSTPVGTSNVVVTGTSGATVRNATAFVLTVNLANYNRTIQIDPEGISNKILSGTLDVLNPSKVSIKTYPFTTNSSGQATISFDISPQVVYLKLNPTPFLARLISLDLNTNTTYVFPKLLTGDLNNDNLINSVDYSVLNGNWFTSNATSDLNKDGLVNSIDFSFMNQHWLVNGDA